MLRLIKKLFFCLLHNFQNWFHNADHLLYYPQRSVFSFHSFLLSYISLSKKWNIETMLTFPYSYNWQTFSNKMAEKGSQEYKSMDSEYVTRQIKCRILELLLKQIVVYIAANQQISFTQKFKFSIPQYLFIKKIKPSKISTRKQPTHFSVTPLRPKLRKNPVNHTI